MARNPSFSAACEADSEKEISGLDADLKVSSTRTNAGRRG
jgi:hypothetical protein